MQQKPKRYIHTVGERRETDRDKEISRGRGVVEGARERETGTKELKKVQHLMLKGILAAGAEWHPLGRAW